jgi:hypothetical protein
MEGCEPMKFDGRCHCGKITFEAEADPEGARICHCTDCQQLSGSAFRTVIPTVEDGFRLLAGEPRTYVKTAESGRKRAQAFCADCGTHIYATSVGEGPKIYGVRIGTLRQRDQIVPRLQLWCRSARPWLGELESIRKIEKQA